MDACMHLEVVDYKKKITNREAKTKIASYHMTMIIYNEFHSHV